VKRGRRWLHVAVTAAVLLPSAACGGLSKSDALEVVRHEVQEEASCTLPVGVLSQLKMQYATKAACSKRDDEHPSAKDLPTACLDALVAAGVTKAMPPTYMSEWTDEVATLPFDAVSPYERRARALQFKTCVEMRDLREGRFHCGEAKAEKVVRLTKLDDARTSVLYARTVTLDPQLPTIEAACGAVSHPAPEATVTLEKVDKKWALAHDDAAPSGSSSAAH
jgi:hypothetical protein